MRLQLLRLWLSMAMITFAACSDDDDATLVDYTEERAYVVDLVDATIDLFEAEVNAGTTDFSELWSALEVSNTLNISTGNEYIFVFRMDDGLFTVHPIIDLDTDIRTVVSEDDPPIAAGQIIYDGAVSNPTGQWTDYSYTNPSTGNSSLKHTYTRVSGNYGFGCGYNED